MGILGSLYTGLSGLAGQSEAMSITGDNIANASNIGFKVSRPEFHDVISKSLKGLLGGNQIGCGVHIAGVNPILSQGAILQTESATDLAITGDGYFLVSGADGQCYTRNGAFHFDKDGKLINADNYHVMGFETDDNGKITTKLAEIGIKRTVIDAKKTSDVKFNLNLDLRAEMDKAFSPLDPDGTSQFATGVTVFDTAGNSHVATLFFNHSADGTWDWRAMAKGEEIVGGKKGENVECAKGKLTFDTDGRLKEQTIEKSSFNFTKGAKPDQFIKFSFGDDRMHGGSGIQVTQYGSPSEAYKVTQDGFAAGTLTGMAFNEDGTLTAVYSNGESMNQAQLSLAKFENPEGMFKMGQNRLRESRVSGQPTVGAPQTGGRGRVSSKTLEASTTDVASELINLMQSQRNFQANSKVVTTADEMLQEVLNLKRN